MSTPQRNEVSGIDLPELAELTLPTPVSLIPQTLAWKLLLAALVFALLLYAGWCYRQYRRRRWRRQASALAQAARANASVDDWFVLIKRVCLVHMGRARVAALGDAETLDQLPELDPAARQALLDGHHRRDARLGAATNEALAQAFARWLQELPDVR
ncbi:DUF4381 family protein [Pseudomonas sp. NPDC090755]|uniref:DUF4381 family protein n=1 Tax=Pseudomonas sp. NPDC090755 TaxID=3364481 RepID=UPI003839DEA3